MKQKQINGLVGLFVLVMALMPASAYAQRQDRSRLAPDSEIREAFEALSENVRTSVVVLEVDGEASALGTVVTADGFILSKASELEGGEAISARFWDERRFVAHLVGIDRLNDLALLRIDADGLDPVQFVDDEPGLGRMLASVGTLRSPVAYGIVSAQPRAIRPPRLVLGVILREVPEGLRVMDLTDGMGAAEAGIRENDVLTRVGDQELLAMQQLVDMLQGQAVGDVVQVSLLRDGEPMLLGVRLSELGPDPRSRSERMNRMGGTISERRSGFQRVLQHDAEIRPDHCGGPVMSLSGEVVGLNIARAGRISTYALPSGLVLERLELLMAGELGPVTEIQAEPAIDGEPEEDPQEKQEL